MPDRDRIERGLDYEARVASVLGLRQVPGSGNGWRNKGDAKGYLVVSCKAEADKGKTWARIKEQLREAIDMAFGTGLPSALALLEDDGDELVVIRLQDLAKVLSGKPLVSERSKGEINRELVDVPVLLRESP